MRLRRPALILSWTLLCCAAADPATQPATQRATAPIASAATQSSLRAMEEGRKAVRAAVNTLVQEYEAHRRDPAVPLRGACTYFKEHPDETITAESVLPSLLATGGDPRLSAYVKWQLLSARPDAIEDDALAKQLLAAYRAAPAPIPRPGISPQDRQKLDTLTQSARPGDEPSLIETLDRAVHENDKANAPVLAYRDELYRRLPKQPEVFAAAMADLHERHRAAADGKDLAKSLVSDMREWAATASPAPPTLLALAKAARRLADTKGPQYYTSPYFNERSGVFSWRRSSASVDSARALKDLAIALEEQSRQPPLDLTIKE